MYKTTATIRAKRVFAVLTSKTLLSKGQTHIVSIIPELSMSLSKAISFFYKANERRQMIRLANGFGTNQTKKGNVMLWKLPGKRRNPKRRLDRPTHPAMIFYVMLWLRKTGMSSNTNTVKCQWFTTSTEVMNKNSTLVLEFSSLYRSALEHGRMKKTNIMVMSWKNRTKSFIFMQRCI